MKLALYIILASISPSAFAAAKVVVPSLPSGEYDDTEAATNSVVCPASETDNRFRLSLELDASTNNCVLVEFGVDADSSGALERGEVEFSVGWDCGEWVWCDHISGCAASVARSENRRRLEWVVALNQDKLAKRLLAFDSGVVFEGAVSPTFHSAAWNMTRIVRRGSEPDMYATYDVSVFPLIIKLR